MNRKPKMQRFPLKAFQAQFPNDAACLEWLKNYFYPDGILCKNCGEVTKHYRIASRPSYCCEHCGNHVHPTAGTIFHKSPTPLTTWFYAMYLMSATRCGISAKQIERETGVTYKTAWRMFKQIRSMLGDEKSGPIGGRNRQVEMDETYYGSEAKGTRGRGTTKAPVVGMVQRKGQVRAFVAADVKADTLNGLIKEHVLPKSTVFTDTFRSYNGLSARGYTHERINHSEGVYVVGEVHTNTIEGFWSLVKRGISGVYHQVGRNYLQTYFDEYSFRYNRRFDEQPMFWSFLQQVEKRDAVVRSAIPLTEPF
ncbi:MAG: IS1595 family transposase [Terriglobales bacterium]|jgi:transposase-like protein